MATTPPPPHQQPPGTPQLPTTNPILSAYNDFERQTPLVTRYVITNLFVTWIISFIFDPSFAIANIAHFTLYKLELYRIVLSPFICTNILSLLFAYLCFVENGKRLEYSMGSAAFAGLLVTITVVINTIFLIIAVLLFYMTGNERSLFWSSLGIWIILFAVIAIECAQAPQHSMRRFFIVTVPTLYYPLALLGVFSIVNGFQLSYVVSIGVGYAYGFGYLDFFKISPTRCKQLEDSTLSNFAARDGWIHSHNATGNGAWQSNDDTDNSTGGLSFFSSQIQRAVGSGSTNNNNTGNNSGGGFGGLSSLSSSSSLPTPNNSTLSSASMISQPTESTFPKAGGRTLGSATRRPGAVDPRQARLQAAEQRVQPDDSQV